MSSLLRRLFTRDPDINYNVVCLSYALLAVCCVALCDAMLLSCRACSVLCVQAITILLFTLHVFEVEAVEGYWIVVSTAGSGQWACVCAFCAVCVGEGVLSFECVCVCVCVCVFCVTIRARADIAFVTMPCLRARHAHATAPSGCRSRSFSSSR